TGGDQPGQEAGSRCPGRAARGPMDRPGQGAPPGGELLILPQPIRSRCTRRVAAPGHPRVPGLAYSPGNVPGSRGSSGETPSGPAPARVLHPSFWEGSTYEEGRSQSVAAAGAGRGHRPGWGRLRLRPGEKRQGQEGREGRGSLRAVQGQRG